MLKRAFEAQVPHAWVSGDEVYGRNPGLRRWLEEQRDAYVLAVSVKESVGLGEESTRVEAIATALNESAWTRLSCGEGSKGPRLYDWARSGGPGPDRTGRLATVGPVQTECE